MVTKSCQPTKCMARQRGSVTASNPAVLGSNLRAGDDRLYLYKAMTTSPVEQKLFAGTRIEVVGSILGFHYLLPQIRHFRSNYAAI